MLLKSITSLLNFSEFAWRLQCLPNTGFQNSNGYLYAKEVKQRAWTDILFISISKKGKKKKKKQTVTYLLYILKRLKVLKINCINTDWSILFFFDLKNYISYCKDVYKYFNLSSVNFFVAGLNLFYFSMALWQRTLYYFNITQLWTELQTIKCVMLWTVFCWDGDFIGSEKIF